LNKTGVLYNGRVKPRLVTAHGAAYGHSLEYKTAVLYNFLRRNSVPPARRRHSAEKEKKRNIFFSIKLKSHSRQKSRRR
jgi:hypothetical protein